MKKIVSLIFMLTLMCPAFGAAGAPQNFIDENAQIVYEEEPEAEEIDLEAAKDTVNRLLSTFSSKAKVERIEKVFKDGKAYVGCVVSYGNTVLTFNMDPKTGKISDMKSNQGNFVLDRPAIVTSKAGVKLTTSQVNKMLKRAMPGAKMEKVKYDKKKGVVSGYSVYENSKYYFEIDANRGSIIEIKPIED